MNGKWMYNKTEDGIWGDDFFPVREKAIKAGREDYPDEDFYIGQCEKIVLDISLDSEHAIDKFSEQIDDDYGDCEIGKSFYAEAIEKYESLQAKLDKAVKEWLDENEFCKGCFVIKNTELISWEPPLTQSETGE